MEKLKLIDKQLHEMRLFISEKRFKADHPEINLPEGYKKDLFESLMARFIRNSKKIEQSMDLPSEIVQEFFVHAKNKFSENGVQIFNSNLVGENLKDEFTEYVKVYFAKMRAEIDERLFVPLDFKQEFLEYLLNHFIYEDVKINLTVSKPKMIEELEKLEVENSYRVEALTKKIDEKTFEIFLPEYKSEFYEDLEVDFVLLLQSLIHIRNDNFSKLESNIIMNEKSLFFYKDPKMIKIQSSAYKEALLYAVPESTLTYLESVKDWSVARYATTFKVTAMDMVSRKDVFTKIKDFKHKYRKKLLKNKPIKKQLEIFK